MLDSMLIRYVHDAADMTPRQRQRAFDELIAHMEEDALDRGELIELGCLALAMARIDLI